MEKKVDENNRSRFRVLFCFYFHCNLELLSVIFLNKKPKFFSNYRKKYALN